MIKTDLHVHTVYCDGKNTPEDIVKSALEKGMECIGFSSHSYTFFDESYCMKRENAAVYRADIAGLKEKYGDRIRILCGVEQDYYSQESTELYDYVIGSVHYLKIGSDYIPIDESPDILKETSDGYFKGDFYALAQEYYNTVGDILNKTDADIIGHFDVISKFNEKHRFFDEHHPRYVSAWKRSADKLLSFKKPFEINTGAISRGYKTSPYPSNEIINYIKDNGGKFVLSSDSHNKNSLCYEFSKYERFV